jgi:uncharacterized membrane protein
MVLTYTLLLSITSLIRQYSFQTSAWDLGIFDQACYSTLRGRIFYYTPELYANPAGSIFGVHFSPILFAIVPLYALFQNAGTLLVIQSIAMGAGAYPVFLIAQRTLGNRKYSYFFSLLYLVYPATYGINIFDFHPDAFFVPFTLFALYFFLKSSWKPYFAFMLLALSAKEFMSIAFAVFALGELIVSRRDVISALKSKSYPSRRVLVAFGTISVAVCWYIVAKLFINFFNPSPPQGFGAGSPWSILGVNLLDPSSWIHLGSLNILQAIGFDLQSKLFYLVTLFAPLAFLPLFKINRASPALLWILIAFLSNYPPYYEVGYQYSAIVIPFIILAAIEGFSRIQSLFKVDVKRANKLATRLFVACVLVSLVLAFQALPSNLQLIISPHDQRLSALVTQIQRDFPNASILTQYDLFPHVSESLNSYVIPPLFSAFDKSYYAEYVQSMFNLTPDFVILDLNPDVRTDAHRVTFLYAFQNLERLDNYYGLYASVDGIFVYKYGYHGPLTMYTPFLLKLDYETRIVTNAILFSSVLPKGTYLVTYQMKLQNVSREPSCMIELTQGVTVLQSRDLYADNGSEPDTFENYTLTVNIASSTTEVMFYVLNPSTSADVYLKSIVVQMEGPPEQI